MSPRKDEESCFPSVPIDRAEVATPGLKKNATSAGGLLTWRRLSEASDKDEGEVSNKLPRMEV